MITVDDFLAVSEAHIIEDVKTGIQVTFIYLLVIYLFSLIVHLSFHASTC